MPQWAINGAQINSALYLVMVFTAGIVTGHRWAWTGAIVAAGLTYFTYLHAGSQWAALAINAVAVLIAAAAGAALLFW